MKSFMCTSLSLASLLLVLITSVWSAYAVRKDSGDYWKGVMKDEPIPVALKALILPSNYPQKSELQVQPILKKPDCHNDVDLRSGNRNHEEATSESFEPRPDVTAYHNGGRTVVVLVEQNSHMEDKMPLPESESFEPRPNVSTYCDGGSTDMVLVEQNSHMEDKMSLPVAESFEPRPNVSTYHDGGSTAVVLVEQNSHMEDKMPLLVAESIEPRPDMTAYGN